jgi:hypothetical protein
MRRACASAHRDRKDEPSGILEKSPLPLEDYENCSGMRFLLHDTIPGKS